MGWNAARIATLQPKTNKMKLPELIEIVKRWALDGRGRPQCTHSLIETEVEQTLKYLSESLDRIELAARRAKDEALKPYEV